MYDRDLTQFQDGTVLTVSAVAGDGPISNRLREIGVIPGARIRVIRQGSPMIVQIGQARFCLRGNEAALVKVQTAESDTAGVLSVSHVQPEERCAL